MVALFYVETAGKDLELQKLPSKLSMKWSRASYQQKYFSRDNHSKNIWDKLWILCEIAPYGKSSISIFQEFLTSIEKTFILVGRLGTSFLILASFKIFLIFPNFWDPKVYVVWQLERQLLYTLFIANNCK